MAKGKKWTKKNKKNPKEAAKNSRNDSITGRLPWVCALFLKIFINLYENGIFSVIMLQIENN